MTGVLSLPFLASVTLAALLASLALWSRRAMPIKVFALAATAAFIAVHYAALTDLLSRPKPLALEWSPPDPETTAVVASQLREGSAIYLWMLREGEEEPRAYQLPWDEDMARQLHEAQRESQQTGQAVRMRERLGGQHSAGERMFYTDPQQPLPDKQAYSEQAAE